MYMKKLNIMSGFIGGLLITFIGGYTPIVRTLLVMVVVDYLLGITNALVFKKSNKTESGGLSSKVGYLGILKKILIFMMIGVMNEIDLMLGSDGLFRNATMVGFITNEFISIVETIGLMNIIKLPNVINKAIDVLKEKEEKGVR